MGSITVPAAAGVARRKAATTTAADLAPRAHHPPPPRALAAALRHVQHVAGPQRERTRRLPLDQVARGGRLRSVFPPLSCRSQTTSSFASSVRPPPARAPA